MNIKTDANFIQVMFRKIAENSWSIKSIPIIFIKILCLAKNLSINTYTRVGNNFMGSRSIYKTSTKEEGVLDVSPLELELPE